MNNLEKSYFNYNPNKDPNGSKGMKLADIVFKNCNYDFDRLHKWIMLGKLKILEELSKTSI